MESMIESALGGIEWLISTLASELPKIHTYMITDPELSQIFSPFFGALANPYILSLILLFTSAIILFFDRRIIPSLAFLLLLFAGFSVGAYYVAPLFEFFAQGVPVLIISAFFALICAIFWRPVYLLCYFLAPALFAFSFVLDGSLSADLAGNAVMSLVASAVAAILALIFRKPIEWCGSVLLGAYFACEALYLVWDYTLLFPTPAYVKPIFALVLALLIAILKLRKPKKNKSDGVP